jgi:hypothetical protein
MAPSRSRNYFTAALLFTLALPSNALYFYMNSGTPKCFFEELPKDTLVVGMLYPFALFSIASLRVLSAWKTDSSVSKGLRGIISH